MDKDRRKEIFIKIKLNSPEHFQKFLTAAYGAAELFEEPDAVREIQNQLIEIGTLAKQENYSSALAMLKQLQSRQLEADARSEIKSIALRRCRTQADVDVVNYGTSDPVDFNITGEDRDRIQELRQRAALATNYKITFEEPLGHMLHYFLNPMRMDMGDQHEGRDTPYDKELQRCCKPCREIYDHIAGSSSMPAGIFHGRPFQNREAFRR